MSFLGEIKRRKVFQVAAVYAVMAWLIIQIVDVVGEPLNLPDWFDTVAIVLLAIGFPIAVILAWAFDLTPDGVVRDQGTNGAPKGRGRTLEYVLIGSLVIAVGFLFVDAYVLNDSTQANVTGIQTLRARDGTVLPKVAVLPCDNLSPDPNDAYFAAGIHEEILNQLAKLSGLLVVARTSVLQYAENRPAIPQIASDLNAQAVMECSVRYAGDSILVTAQLIDPETDAHLWSETYPGDLSDLGAVFAMQADIAMNISDALQVEFSLEERQRIEKPLTSSPEALRLYLQATNLGDPGPGGTGSNNELHEYLDQAIQLDSQFARAYALKAHDYAYAMVRGRLPDDLEVRELERLAYQNAAAALSLDPEENLAYVVFANIARFTWRATEAEAAFLRALRLAPSDPTSLRGLAHFFSFLEEHEQATEYARLAIELNPSLGVLANVYRRAGDFDAADSAINEIPGLPDSSMYRWRAVFEWHRGNSESALENIQIAESAVADNDPQGLANLIQVYGLLGHREEALRLLEHLQQVSGAAHVRATDWALAYMGAGYYEQALMWLNHVDQQRSPEDSLEAFDFAINSFHNPALEREEFLDVRNRLALRR